MSVHLTNLLARIPEERDMYSIMELVAICGRAEHGIADSSTEELQAHWRNHSFHLESDAWVIVNNKGQFVGFGCVCHSDYEEYHTFVCVHPDYRKRGIGTLLLRLIEERARQQMFHTSLNKRVCLKALVSSYNTEARNLFRARRLYAGARVLARDGRIGRSSRTETARWQTYARRGYRIPAVGRRRAALRPGSRLQHQMVL